MTRAESSDAAPGWRHLLDRLHLAVDTGSFPAALDFAAQVGTLAARQDQVLEIEVRRSLVRLVVGDVATHAVRDEDIALANAISALMVGQSLAPSHERLSETEIAIDTMDRSAIMPFWAAVLQYVESGDDAIADPDGHGPTYWFQQMGEPRPQRNRFHVDVTVAHDEAERRIQRALDAGGRLLSDERAPSFWILADADGNEVCMCTWEGRD